METRQVVQEGADVRGSQGERLGTVEEVRTDSVSGQQTSFIVKTGFWIFGKNKMLTVDTIERIEDDANTVVVGMSKDEFRGIPQFSA